MSANAMIEINNLNLIFGEGSQQNQVLFDVNLAVKMARFLVWWANPVPVKPRC